MEHYPNASCAGCEVTLMLFHRDEGNHKFSTTLVVQYIHLSLLIKILKPDQGVLHSIGHVMFIMMEIGGYLQYIDIVSKFASLLSLFLSRKQVLC